MSKNKEQANPVCFVIMPFSDPEGYEKGHFRKIYEQIFKPAIEIAGYEPHRVDENNESTLIQGKLLDQLVNAPMVLCDLSSKNPNVLYELGIRHAFDKPVVLVQEAGQAHIFDVAGISTVEYRKARLYDEVVEDQEKIASAIQQTASTKKNYSIMSLAKIAHATVSHEDSISVEDRLEILVRDIVLRLNKIEDKITAPKVASTNTSSIVKSYSVDGVRDRLISKARFEMEQAQMMAEVILADARKEIPHSQDEIKSTYDRLDIAIRQHLEQSGFVEDTAVMRARVTKFRLKDLLSEG